MPGATRARSPACVVLELGHFVAAPFCTRLLADLGADVIKVEPPGAGDPVRQWGARHKGDSAWWSVHGRNKHCVTLDLKKPRARELALQLAARSDALVENFRPGQLEKLGLGEAALRAVATFEQGLDGDHGAVTDALATLRALGLEDEARIAALEFLILGRASS